MNKLRAIFVVALLFALPFSFFGCKAEPETTTVTSTISVNQTITLTSTYTASPQTTTKTEVKTVTETVSKTATTDTTTKPVTTTTKPITTTETRTEIPEMEIEIVYEGEAKVWVEIIDVAGFVTSTEVIITGKGQNVLPCKYNIQGIFYNDSGVEIGSSPILAIKAVPGNKPFEIQFTTPDPLSIKKCILIISG